MDRSLDSTEHVNTSPLTAAAAPPASAVDDEPFQFGLGGLFLLVACVAIVLGVLIRIGWLLLGAYVVYCAYLTILLIPYVLWLTLRRLLDALSHLTRLLRRRGRGQGIIERRGR